MYSNLFYLTLLAVSLSACGESRFRLDGTLPEDISSVALLDGQAESKVTRLQDLYRSAGDSLLQVAESDIAVVRQRLKETDDELSSAQGRLRTAQRQYAQTFRRIKRFTSFGGNAIFTDADVRVSTKVLLEGIAKRFYKGKAFSLETGGEVRSFVREHLVPAERRVARARRRIASVEAKRKDDVATIEERRGRLEREQARLLSVYNQRILDTLSGAILERASADSLGYYRFDRLLPAPYHLYIEQAPTLAAVTLDRHRRRDLRVDADASPLISVEDQSL